MLALTSGPASKNSFEDVKHRAVLNTDKQSIAYIEIAAGKCFEAMQKQGREETMTIIKGNGLLEIGDESKEISPICLVKLSAKKACRIFNNSKEIIALCFVSTPSKNANEEFYIKRKENCNEIKTGNKEHIYELFGVYGNGPSTSHSVALVEIEEGGGTHPHTHPSVEESYFMIDGKAKLIVGEETTSPEAWEATLIPVGKRHQISNIGNGILKFLAVVTPPWTRDCGIYETSV